MIKFFRLDPTIAVSPQAIFFRPLRYFTVTIEDGEDGLDTFQGASFGIGNHLRFDLRTYRRHAKVTVTLYLPDELEDQKEVLEAIHRVMKEMVIPATAVAWQRGDPIIWGQVTRKTDDRLSEAEARIVALKIASQRPNRTASTKYIKREVPNFVDLSPLDLAPSQSRPEPVWRQIVGNVISHQNVSEGPFVQGYATRTPTGLAVTDKGMAYLNNMGFSAST
jgi:hypothetical protein